MLCRRKDYDNLPHFTKNAVKAIIFSDGRIGQIYFNKNNLYDFPGGGIEDGETIDEALIREIKEEAGATVIPSSIKEFELGKYVTIYKDNQKNVIIERYFSYYFCEIEDGYTEPQLEEYEIADGQQFVFVSIDEAISTNKLHIQQGNHWVENPTSILKLLKNNFA